MEAVSLSDNGLETEREGEKATNGPGMFPRPTVANVYGKVSKYLRTHGEKANCQNLIVVAPDLLFREFSKTRFTQLSH